MNNTIHQPHDKLFKLSLKKKEIAIPLLKAHLTTDIFNSININSLQLTDKSFITPELREIHSDIIYKCRIKQKSGYLFF